MMGYLAMAWEMRIKLQQPSQMNSNCEYIAYPTMTASSNPAMMVHPTPSLTGVDTNIPALQEFLHETTADFNSLLLKHMWRMPQI
jgi:hypothetical protein